MKQRWDLLIATCLILAIRAATYDSTTTNIDLDREIATRRVAHSVLATLIKTSLVDLSPGKKKAAV